MLARPGADLGGQRRGQHLVGARRRGDRLRDAERPPGHRLAGGAAVHRLELADVHALSQRQPPRRRQRPQRHGAAHGAGRAVETQRAGLGVAAHRPPAEARRRLAGGLGEAVQRLGPAAVGRRPAGGARRHRPPGEQRRQHAARLGVRRRAGQELLDGVDGGVDVAGPERMVAAFERPEDRAGDMPRQVAPRFRVDPRVLHPVQHQRRHPDRRQDAAHVDRGVHPHQRRRRRRRAGEPLEPRPPGGEVRVRDAPGGERRERRPGAPAPLGLGGEAFGRLGRQHPAVEVRIAAVEHQRPGPLRAGGGEQQRHRRPLAGPEDRRPAAAGGVHHRAHVVHPGLEVGQMRRVHPVGEPGAALVEVDQPREPRQPPQQPGVARVLPVHLEVRQQPRHEHQVERALPDHLIGDPVVAAPRVACLRQPHDPHLRRSARPQPNTAAGQPSGARPCDSGSPAARRAVVIRSMSGARNRSVRA